MYAIKNMGGGVLVLRSFCALLIHNFSFFFFFGNNRIGALEVTETSKESVSNHVKFGTLCQVCSAVIEACNSKDVNFPS